MGQIVFYGGGSLSRIENICDTLGGGSYAVEATDHRKHKFHCGIWDSFLRSVAVAIGGRFDRKLRNLYIPPVFNVA